MMRVVCALAIAAVCGPGLATAQRQTGEIRVSVSDPGSAPVDAQGLVTGEATQIRRQFSTNREGSYFIKDLPFGIYHLDIRRPGFTPVATLVTVHSPVPIDLKIKLALAPVTTDVTVKDSRTLLDPAQTMVVYRFGSDALNDRESSLPSRSVVDVVNQQPGVLLEANGVLHPRGSEYDVQYVVDGVPITDNRSPGFAPQMEADNLESVTVLTGGYPAEYGRKLGGIVELVTERDTRRGFHGRIIGQGGSFGTLGGLGQAQYSWGRNTFSVSGDGARTDRYLDSPVEGNYTNQGSNGGLSARFERDLTDLDRIRIYVHRERAGFLVPNELIQQAAGQRQDRANEETMGQISYQRILSPRWIAELQTMARDVSSRLWSNPFSTPILADQDRGFREAYVRASVSGHLGANDLKFGAEANFDSLNERFAYQITPYGMDLATDVFPPGTPLAFAFADRRNGRDQGAYVEDVLHAGRFTLRAGVRWDHYRRLVGDSAFSPRLGAAWSVPSLGLVLRASYDRMFQTPAMENLLLSSSEAVRQLSDSALFLSVRPSRGNQYEAGFTKGLFGNVRLTGTYYLRRFDNFADDDVLLNTGVSFPIAFHSASIRGFESKLEIPRWGPISGYLSYSNMLGIAQFPVAGGLFLEGDPTLLTSRQKFPVTQDQRNTARARFRWQAAPRLWLAVGTSYGSGLPIEQPDQDVETLVAQYGSAILSRVNLDRGRVRPSFSLDASVGATVWHHEHRSVTLQADVENLTDRLNVINFAGLFSGTAVAAPRTYFLRMRTEW